VHNSASCLRVIYPFSSWWCTKQLNILTGLWLSNSWFHTVFASAFHFDSLPLPYHLIICTFVSGLCSILATWINSLNAPCNGTLPAMTNIWKAEGPCDCSVVLFLDSWYVSVNKMYSLVKDVMSVTLSFLDGEAVS